MYSSQPKYRAPQPRPPVLTDDLVKQKFSGFAPRLHDGPFPVFGKVIGWDYHDGRLGAIVVNPQTDRRFLFGIDLHSGKIVLVGDAPRRKR